MVQVSAAAAPAAAAVVAAFTIGLVGLQPAAAISLRKGFLDAEPTPQVSGISEKISSVMFFSLFFLIVFGQRNKIVVPPSVFILKYKAVKKHFGFFLFGTKGQSRDKLSDTNTLRI